MRYRLNPSKEPITMHELVAARIPGRPLPGPLYVSQQAFDLDLDAIFGRHWIFVASEPEIPAPGDYLTVDVDSGSFEPGQRFRGRLEPSPDGRLQAILVE